MKRYFSLFGSVFFLFLPVQGKAQEDSRPGGWSVAITSGGQYSLSSSMHGDIAQYEAALASGTTPAQYPFAANRAFGLGFGVQAEYKFHGNQWSLYASGFGSSFTAGSGFRNSPTGRFTMTIISTSAGIQYTFGQLYQIWNFYGRVGIVPSTIAVSNRSGGGGGRFFYDSLRLNTLDSRMGMEIEIGERYHFPRLPIGIEASINYTVANLFGKTFIDPNLNQGLFAASSSINDGKNPNDPADNSRTIDFLSVRIGARFYF